MPTMPSLWDRVLVKLLISLPARLSAAVDRTYARFQRVSRRVRTGAALWVARSQKQPVLFEGNVLVPERRPTSAVVAEILGKGCTSVLDVGARWGGEAEWWRLAPLATLIGFEPDAEECQRLNSKGLSDEKYVPLALGAADEVQTLYITEQPASSSLLPPVHGLADRYPSCSEMRVASTVQVRVQRLQEWWEAQGRPATSFIKIDTQGSELPILRGAGPVLDELLGCEVEAEFSPLYTNQPLFTDLDAFLRQKGFVLWGLKGLTHYRERPQGSLPEVEEAYFTEHRLHGDGGRLFWANAIYLRDHREIPVTAESSKKLMILAALLDGLGDADSARACLKRLLSEGAQWLPEAGRRQLQFHAQNLY